MPLHLLYLWQKKTKNISLHFKTIHVQLMN